MDLYSLPIGRKEVAVRGDGNCFYRSMALAVDGKSDKNFANVRAMCNNIMLQHPTTFNQYLFTHTSMEKHLEKSLDSGTWGETVDIFACSTALQRSICVYSMLDQKWSRFDPRLVLPPVLNSPTTCDCAITLVLYDFHRASCHFNLLQPVESCCSAPKPDNIPRPPVSIDLDSWDAKAPISSENVGNKPQMNKCKSSPVAKKKPKLVPSTNRKSKANIKKENKLPKIYTPRKKQNKVPKIHPPKVTGLQLAKESLDKSTDHVQTTKQNLNMELNEQNLDVSNNIVEHKFEEWTVKKLKDFVGQRGLPTTNYKKSDLIELAKAAEETKLPIDPDFANDSLKACLEERLTLPAGKQISDPFKMTHHSKDMSPLPSFGLLDIFNHLIASEAQYDKEMLASWRTFDEYKLHQNGYVRDLNRVMVYDNDDSAYHVMTANVIPTQKEKTPEGRHAYRLWFIISPNGSVYSAFCECKGGSDQGCKHLGASLFELEEFLSDERTSVTSLPAYWQPKPKPRNKPLPLLELKLSHSIKLKRKRQYVPVDDSWIDSFEPMPNRLRCTMTEEEKADFARKLAGIDDESGILDFLPGSSRSKARDKKIPIINFNRLRIINRAQIFVRKNRRLIKKDIDKGCKNFVETLTCTKTEQSLINVSTVGQSENEQWHKMRHLMVTGKKVKSIYTRQKTLERKPFTNISKTVKNFLEEKSVKINSAAMQYGIDHEKEALYFYCKVSERKHEHIQIEEPGLLVDTEHSWLGASLDGVRKCECCKARTLEIKCPYIGKEMEPKSAFLLPSVGGVIDKNGKRELHKNHIHYFQVQIGMAIIHMDVCDFIVYTSKGIEVVEVNFDADFWKDVFDTVSLFYTKQLVKNLLLKLV